MTERFPMPPKVTAYVDQYAAQMRDEGAGQTFQASAKDLAQTIADTLEQLAQGVEEIHAKTPGVRLTLPEVAALFRNNARAYQALADQLPTPGENHDAGTFG